VYRVFVQGLTKAHRCVYCRQLRKEVGHAIEVMGAMPSGGTAVHQ
jgi:hypothetical protein